MLTRDFRLVEERTRYPLKPLFSHFFLPAPLAIARLDIRLRRAALYPAELRVPRLCSVPITKRCAGVQRKVGPSSGLSREAVIATDGRRSAAQRAKDQADRPVAIRQPVHIDRPAAGAGGPVPFGDPADPVACRNPPVSAPPRLPSVPARQTVFAMPARRM